MDVEHFRVEFDPKPDARAAEEQRIVDAANEAFGHGVFLIMIGAAEPGAPKRFIGVLFLIWPWHYRRFRARTDAIEKAVRKVVHQPDAVISVKRAPLRHLLPLAAMRLLDGFSPPGPRNTA